MTIDLPTVLHRATKLSWSMEANHGLASSPFSGIVQAQRGAMERWKFTMDIRRMNRADAQEAMAFFMNLEGSLNTFRMSDPSAGKPLGKATGLPVVASATAAGSRTLPTAGWTPNIPAILKAGDWIQIGDQLSRLRADAASAADGTATLDLWPRLYLAATTETPLTVRNAKGIFRFTSEMPAFDLDAGAMTTPYTFNLTGTQEILTPPE